MSLLIEFLSSRAMHCCENLCSKGCLSMSLALLCPWSKLIFGAELTVVEGACVVSFGLSSEQAVKNKVSAMV
jgi:hypothetical protein